MDVTPGLPAATDNFQDWPPPLVVETARRILDYTGGTLVMPMIVLDEQYWREIIAPQASPFTPSRYGTSSYTPITTPAQVAQRIADDINDQSPAPPTAG